MARSSSVRITFTLAAIAVAALSLSARASGDEFEPDRIDFQLEEPAAFTLRNVLAPLTSLLLGGPGYWYDTRDLAIESSPPGAQLELFYVRASFQRRYQRGEAPLMLTLPSRIDSLARDTLRVRAFLPGYRQVERSYPIHTAETSILLVLDPLPNRLDSLAYRQLAGRAALVLLTTEPASLRLQEEADGFTVFLASTAMAPSVAPSLVGLADEFVSEVVARQVGEDLAVRVDLRPGVAQAVEFRSRNGFDAARALHSYAIDAIPRDRGADSIRRARAALASIGSADVRGCALAFDESLRNALDASELARALEPRGDFTDRYVRAAMRRFGELAPDGIVEVVDGARYRPQADLELDAALSRAGAVRGFLALLRAFARRLDEEHAQSSLRSLLAPELSAGEFGVHLERSEAAERDCLRTHGSRGSTPVATVALPVP